MFLVGLEVAALGPLVPRIDEDEALLLADGAAARSSASASHSPYAAGVESWRTTARSPARGELSQLGQTIS